MKQKTINTKCRLCVWPADNITKHKCSLYECRELEGRFQGKMELPNSMTQSRKNKMTKSD